MDIKSYSDARLISLHRQKKIAIFFILYNRYRNYGYYLIQKILKSTPYFNALYDERDALLYDALIEAINGFNKSRGDFRGYLTILLLHKTTRRIDEFKKDPIADYVSIDGPVKTKIDLANLDALTFADKDANPRDLVTINDEINAFKSAYRGPKTKYVEAMIRLKEQGYSNSEIAQKLGTTPKAVRATFYRLRNMVYRKKSKKR